MANRDPYLIRVGTEIRRCRERLGLSQEAFAQLAGLHRTYVGALERGERNATLSSLQRVASALGLTLAELLAASESNGARR